MSSAAADEAERIRRYYADASWRPGTGRDLLVRERRDALERILKRQFSDLAGLRICDVGCGSGADLAHWSAAGVRATQLFGTELQAARAEAARRAVPGAAIAVVDGFDISLPDDSVDLVTANLVLSSVLDASARAHLLAEMFRVVRAGGMVAVYDFAVRKPWNRNVVAIGRRELERSMGPAAFTVRLAPFLPILEYVLKLPSPLRSIGVGLLPRTHRLWVWVRSA